MNGIIGGPGALTQGYGGTLVLTGANTYTGGTNIEGGPLKVSADSNLGAQSGSLSFNGGILWIIGPGFSTPRSVTLSAEGGTIDVAPAGVLTMNGVIEGSGSLNKTDAGTLVLAGANTYTVGTAIRGGTLQVSADDNLGAESGILVFDGGTLAVTGPDLSSSRSVILYAGGGTIDVAPAGVLTMNGVIGDSGSLNKTDAGTLVLTGANSYTGGTAINGGTVQVSADDNLGVAAGGLSFDGGTLAVTAPGFSTSRNVTLNTDGGTIDVAPAGVLTMNGVIGDSGSLNKTDAGTLVLTGANTYTGGTALNGGTLQVSADHNLGAATGSLSFDGGTLATTAPGFSSSRNATLYIGGGTIDVAPAGVLGMNGIIDGPGRLTKSDAGTLVLTGANSYTGGTAINGGTVQVSADDNLGAATGSLSFDGGTLAVTAPGFSTSRNVTLNTDGGTIDVAPAGVFTMNGVISGPGSLNKTDAGTLVLTGASSYTGGTAINGGTLQLGNGASSGSIIGNVIDNGTLAFNRSDTLIFGDVVSGNGSLVQMGTGSTVLTNANTYSGPTSVPLGRLIVNGSIHSPVTVLPTGTLAGSGLVNGNVVNKGTVWPGIPQAGSTDYGALTIRGNYSDPQARVVFNTFLGSDGSPSSQLILDGGTAEGTSTVVVHVTGTNGARSQQDGIRVVQAINGATTAPDTFVLGNEVRGGDLDYRLFRGGVNGNAPDDWFLRSDFVVGPLQTGEPSGIAFESTVPLSTTLPLDPPPAVLPPGEYPIIGPELATYSVIQPIARQLGLTALGTMHERTGDTLSQSPGGTSNAAWGRLFGQQIDNRYETFTDARSNGHLVGFQTGLDIWQGSFLAGHQDSAGVYFAYDNSKVDIDGLVTNPAATAYTHSHTGALNLNAYTGGAYLTHYGPGGWYVDTVLQGTHYDGDASTQFARLPVSGAGILTSLEAGYPFALPLGSNFVLEPQTQLIWQHVGLNQANDGEGTVDPGSTSGVTGRLGLRGQWTIERANGQVWQPYVRTNAWRDWGAQATTTFDGVDKVPLAQQNTRMDVAAGFTAKLGNRLSLYGQSGYEFSISSPASGKRQGVWGDIGIRYAW